MHLTEEKADLYDAALDHANDVRQELGLKPVTELLPGVPTSSFFCPISTTILAGLDKPYSCSSYGFTTIYDCPVYISEGGDTLFVNDEHETVVNDRMSELSHSFQRAFDRGEFPELIAE